MPFNNINKIIFGKKTFFTVIGSLIRQVLAGREKAEYSGDFMTSVIDT
jgi:hypothetical protein